MAGFTITQEQADARRKLLYAKLAQICDKFRCLPNALSQLTEMQIDEILYHKRDSKTGQIIFPGQMVIQKASGKSKKGEGKHYTMDKQGNVMTDALSKNWTRQKDKAKLKAWSHHPAFANLFEQPGSLEAAMKKMDEKWDKIEADRLAAQTAQPSAETKP